MRGRGRVRVRGERKNITKKLDILLKQKNQRESEGISHPVHLSLSLYQPPCVSHLTSLSLTLSRNYVCMNLVGSGLAGF